MNVQAERELVLNILREVDDKALEEAIWKLETDSPRLITHEFTDGEGGECIINLFGRNHPDLRNSDEPGIQFLELVGIGSTNCRVILEWDNNPLFKAELLEVLRFEQRYRRGVRHARRRVKV